MVIRIVLCLLAVAATGCFEDRYRCTSDAQCDLGEAGRCETTGYCTSYDPACPTGRSYESHTGELASSCYDDRAVPLNACAGGQPPASPIGCFASVCERLPACCDIAWTDACVQLAQQECDITCDTRLAITAMRNTNIELWDVRWDGVRWSVERETRLSPPYAWVAPAPGTLEPRLSGTTATTLEIGEASIAVGADRTYQAITSIGVDRDQRDTIVAGYDTATGATLEIWKLDDRSVREMPLSGNVDATSLAWGDLNRDGFPDAVSRTGTSAYTFIQNLDGDRHVRRLSNQVQANTAGGQTPGAPQVRSLDWLDFDGDHQLDLVAFGASVRIHTNAAGLRDIPEHDLDCIPPAKDKPCGADPEPNLERASFGGAALPVADDPGLVIATFPGRKLYRARPDGDTLKVTRLPFPGDACTCPATCTMCPGPNCSCTYDCSTCLTVVAVVARDLDGDHELDLIAIDSKLHLYTALAATSYAWTEAAAIPATFTNTFGQVAVSVSGAPR